MPPSSTPHPVIFATMNRGPHAHDPTPLGAPPTVVVRATPSPAEDVQLFLEEVTMQIDRSVGMGLGMGGFAAAARAVGPRSYPALPAALRAAPPPAVPAPRDGLGALAAAREPIAFTLSVDLMGEAEDLEREAAEGLFLLVRGIARTSMEGAAAAGGMDVGRPRHIRMAKRRHDALLEEHQRQAASDERAEDGRNDRESQRPAARARPPPTDRRVAARPPLRNVSFDKPEDVGDKDSAKRRPSSTARVAKYRANLRAAEGGAARLRAKGRADNRKHYLKVKRLKADIAAREKALGIASKAATKAPKMHLPPVEELRRMSLEELSGWKRRRRVERRKEASRERNRTESIRALEARLVELREMQCRASSKPAIERRIADMPPCVTE